MQGGHPRAPEGASVRHPRDRGCARFGMELPRGPLLPVKAVSSGVSVAPRNAFFGGGQ
jgi:hypothetical protein